MSEIVMNSTPRRGFFSNGRLNLVLAWGLPVLIVLAGLVYWLLPMLANPPAPENAPMPVNAAFEEKYGVRITMLAVTADGGMVDFRYVILDPDKARTFAIDANTTPILYPQTGKTILSETAPMPHKEFQRAGVTNFLLYHNTYGSIKPRTYVTVVLGSIKLERVPVR
jgi:uncharacterized protein YjeT (DUF2065 family)